MEAAEQDRRRKEYAATLESEALHLKEKLEALHARESRTSSALQDAVQETFLLTLTLPLPLPPTPTLAPTLTPTPTPSPSSNPNPDPSPNPNQETRTFHEECAAQEALCRQAHP